MIRMILTVAVGGWRFRMKVISPARREISRGGAKVADLFKQLDLVPESYLVPSDGELLTIDMPVGPTT